MTISKRDILAKEDVSLLINEFYTRVREDPQLAPHFADIDWDHHTPIIIDFWNMLLLGDQAYKGNPFAKHLRLTLTTVDFQHWLQHFTTTVDSLFTGEKAEEAKMRAQSIAGIFQHRMGLI
jgi:hemoglobin